jgi:hypothetical protein
MSVLLQQQQVIACAALLLAAAMLHLAPKWVRQSFVVVVFSCGLLAAAAGFGGSLAQAAAARLFG